VPLSGERHLAPITNNSNRRSNKMILNGINEVSKETGIHPSSLRRWETLGFIAPGRISFGETWVRVYSDEDVEVLKRVKKLMDEGYKLRAAFERVSNEG
jgi:DNA-binding transcriptional MerR regulator